MDTIAGTKLHKLPEADLHKIGDLLYMYYPLQTLYRTSKGELYMCNWMEHDDTYSRWLLFKVSINIIVNYLNNKLSDLQLLQTVRTSFICFDVDANENHHNIVACSLDDLPLSYLPKPSALFDGDDSPDIREIRAYLLENAPKTCPVLEVSY